MQPKVVLVGFLDTKLAEHQYLRDQLAQHGCEVITLDVSVRTGSNAPPWVSYTAEQISSSASSPKKYSELVDMKRTNALQIMADGALNVIQTLLTSQSYPHAKFPAIHTLVGLGGSTSTSFVCSIFTSSNLELPFGFPKVCITTMASGDVGTYIGDSDLVLIPTIADISGYLNFVTETTLRNAAAAIAGMATVQLSRSHGPPVTFPVGAGLEPKVDIGSSINVTIRVALTMFGLTTPCVSAICAHLKRYQATVPAHHPALEMVDEKSQRLVTIAKKSMHFKLSKLIRLDFSIGQVPVRICFEPIVFHATGAGGRNMEKLVRSGDISAIIDLTTTELADELCGGVLTAGPNRLQAAPETRLKLGKRVVQVISCGAMDMVNFGAWDSVPNRYMGEEQKASQGRGGESKAGKRQFYKHNNAVTLMRTSEEESRMLGIWLARKALGIEKHPSLPLTPSLSDENTNTSHPANTTILIPTLGFSGIDKESQPFFNPKANQSLLEGLKDEMTKLAKIVDVEEDLIVHSNLPAAKTKRTIYQYLEETVEVIEIDCNINDPPMAFEAVVLLLRLLGLPLSALF